MTLTLYAESGWISPWVFHAMVAIEEKQLAYQLEVAPLPLPAEVRGLLAARALIGKVPVLAHGEVWLGESLAISEYLAETFPAPGHPRIFPADLAARGRAREVMSYLRTSLMPLRAQRPTTSLFGGPSAQAPLTAEAAADAAELLRIAGRLVTPGATAMFGAFCIADADLALALMRLIKNGDPVPAHLVSYAQAVWARPSVQRFVTQPRA